MTHDELDKRIAVIQEHVDERDYEAAACSERALLVDFVRHVASGASSNETLIYFASEIKQRVVSLNYPRY